MPLTIAPLAGSPVNPAALDRALTLTGALRDLADAHPDFECLTILRRDGSDVRMTLGALWQRAGELAACFRARGVTGAQNVLLILPTGGELVSAYFGAMLAGGVPSVLAGPTHRFANPSIYAGLVRLLVANAGASLIYCQAGVAAMLEEGLAGLAQVLTPETVAPAEPIGVAADPRPDDVATMQYSSGSTGVPKGVRLTHRTMLNNIRAVRSGLDLQPSDVSVNWIPLYHDMGLIDAFLLPLLGGCPTVLMPTTDFMRAPGLWLRALHAYGGTISWAPNFAYALCANRLSEADLSGLDLSRWRIAINAAEPVAPETIEAFARAFAPYGFRPEAMTPAWGLAENVTLATAHPIAEAPLVESIDRAAVVQRAEAVPSGGDGLRTVAVGRALPHCAIQIRDEHGRPLPDRRIGTIWLRSDSLFSGYHDDETLTARVLVEGWLNTGDRGYLVDGHLFFISREKDLIIVGGEKYSPHHVESVINAIPGVRAGCAVVFGVANDHRGTEEAFAVVESRESDEHVRAALVERIREETLESTGLALGRVLIVDPGGVQKTTSGKLARGATQERWASRLVLR